MAVLYVHFCAAHYGHMQCLFSGFDNAAIVNNDLLYFVYLCVSDCQMNDVKISLIFQKELVCF